MPKHKHTVWQRPPGPSLSLRGPRWERVLTCDRGQMGSQQFVAPVLHLAAARAAHPPSHPSRFHLDTRCTLPQEEGLDVHRWTTPSQEQRGRRFVPVCMKK